MELEYHQLELKYAALTILDPKSQARLMASLAQQGQQNPVLVLKNSGSSGYVLIDGYRRVDGLKQLGRDTVRATVLEMDEISALVYKHAMESRGKRTAIEDAWLIRELMETHRLSQEEIAVKLGKSASWVSRRLALVSVLSGRIQTQIRKGRISPQAGMKYLVPLARANPEQCDELVGNLGAGKLSVREMRKVYIAWKSAPSSKRDCVVKNPILYARAHEEISQTPVSKTGDCDTERPLTKDIRIIKSVARRAGEQIRNGIKPVSSDRAAWDETVIAFRLLDEQMRSFAS